MRDVYLWTGLAVGSVFVGALIVAAVRRWLDWLDRRAYVPPTTVHTDVRPLATGGVVKPMLFVEPEPCELLVPLPKLPEVSGWALDALADARKEAADTYATLGEFARPVATASAPIWAEIYGRRHVQGLAIA